MPFAPSGLRGLSVSVFDVSKLHSSAADGIALFEKLEAKLGQYNGNLTRAAERLGLNPTYLHRLIGNLGLRDKLAG